MKKNGPKIMCLIVLCAASFAQAESKKPQMGDSWVTAKTKIALFADQRVRGREINVETKSGVVMLRGKVDSDEAKAAAAELAKSVDGASSVKNELQVVPRAARAAVAEKDEVLTHRVSRELKKDKHLRSVGVQVHDGVVSLNGKVDTLPNSAMASWKAWRVDGVWAVRNDITVNN